MVTEKASSKGNTGLSETSATGTKTSPVGYLNLSESEFLPRHMDFVNGMMISSALARVEREISLSRSSCFLRVVLSGLSSSVFVTFMLRERGGLISISVPNGGWSGPSRRSMIERNWFVSEKVRE